jgi:hypothetical protein
MLKGVLMLITWLRGLPHRFQLPHWIRDIRAWQFFVALLALAVAISVGLERHWESQQRVVAINTVMVVDMKSGFTDGVSWPVFIALANAGPAEGKNISAHLQLVSPQRIRHAAPYVVEKPAGTSVEVSAHGHEDEYVFNIKNLVPQTAVTIQIEFRAENEAVKREFLDKFKANPFSGVFLAEFVKELSFSGENVVSEITVGQLPSVSKWNGFDVLRNGSQSR